ncbi:GumC family protein [Novosphingobium soli]|uniref:non-specific protein-tyrosine kinase n=1 Tax=Novosphingobium soli TaxID=574956 RepID=A0ABV6CWG3_9SPHN
MRQASMPSGRPYELEPGDLADPADEHRLLVADEQRRRTFDVRVIWSAIYRHRIAVSIILTIALLAGIASIVFMPRIYQATASVQIDQQTAKVLGTEDMEPIVSGSDAERFLQTQLDILESRGMAKQVIDRLGLDKSTAFLEDIGITSVEDLTPAEKHELLLTTVQKNLSADLPLNSRVLKIAFSTRDADLSARVANAYAEQFIQANIQRKFSTGDYSRDFLKNQLDKAKQRLEASERDLISYSRAARLIDASAGAAQVGSPEGPRSLVTANLVQLNQAYAQANAARLEAEQRWEQARGVPVTNLPEVLSNLAIQQLLQKRAELNADMSRMQQHMRSDHPTVLQAQAQIAELDKRANALAENIRASIRNQYLTARKQEQAIERQLNSLKTDTLSEQDRSVHYTILKREVDTNREMYEGLLARYKELSAEAGVANNNITIVDRADPPLKPSSPRKKLNLAAALGIGFILAFLYVYGREKLDDAIRDPRDVETKLHLPLIGIVPAVADGDILEALRSQKSAISEAYHSIRSAVELSSNRGLPHSLVVTSSAMGEGKSTTSYALARDFAQVGRRVLLIDADMRRPSLTTFFGGAKDAPGLSSVLARMNDHNSVIVRSAEPNLSYMPAGPLPPDPASLFSGNALTDLLDQLSGEFDLVILDAPPVMALADSVQIASIAQVTVFVVEAGSAHFGQARNAVTRLLRARAEVIGGIVTKYDPRVAGYDQTYESYTTQYG